MGKLLLLIALGFVVWWMVRPQPQRPPLRQSKPAPPAPGPLPRPEPEGDGAVAMVRVYDATTREVVWMATSELAPGMVEARVEGVEGLVWVERTGASPSAGRGDG